jgi:hypothetical protein
MSILVNVIGLAIFAAAASVAIWARRRDNRKRREGTFKPVPRRTWLLILGVLVVIIIVWNVIPRQN